MPFDEFDDRDASRKRAGAFESGLLGQAAAAFQALLGDVAYFWWAFAGLGAVMLFATAC